VAFRWSFRGTHLGDWLGIPPTGNHIAATGISVYRMAGGKVVENWTSINLSPTEEEQRWLAEGGGWPRRSPDIPATERDTSQIPIWDVLTRNLTWRFRVAEAQERERIEQELQVSRRIQQASLPEEVPELEGWEIVLEAGESFLFYSDGLVEAHDPKRQMFGFPRLRALVAEHGEERSLVDLPMEELYSFTGDGWEQEDDITLVTLRRSAAGR
jgi:hypothetical protein